MIRFIRALLKFKPMLAVLPNIFFILSSPQMWGAVSGSSSAQTVADAGSAPEKARKSTRSREQQCQELKLTGEVAEGQGFSAPIGEGWVFRMVPIRSSGQRYSGWDLVVNPIGDGVYPDALLLATPPFDSVNQREVGTTFGLRAQDAVAWTPRHFHFLVSAADLRQARELFGQIMPFQRSGEAARKMASAKLLSMLSDPSRTAAGQFSVLDARLFAGVADAPPFAEQWAAHLSQVPHTIDQSESQSVDESKAQTGAAATPRGELHWIRFEVTLWLPMSWKAPSASHTQTAKCAE